MADYDIFREQLAIKYPSYGHALWGPSPKNPDKPVQVGDVGFIHKGKFHRLFNALLPADDPSHERGVPEYHEPLIPNLPDHLDTDSLDRNDYCSAGVRVEPDPGYRSGPDDFPQVAFCYKRVPSRGAAVLSLPVTARREDTLARGDFRRWIVKHIDSWFAFARRLGLGIEQMEDIILVTGCDLTRSWTNVAFLGSQDDARVSFGVRVEGPDTSFNFQSSRGNRGAVLRHGPEGTNLPENQCVFIRGFRVARSFWILPRRLKAAAGPSPDPGGYDCDLGTEIISVPAITKVKDSARVLSVFSDASKYRDPLHLLLEYIAEQVPDCDMVLAHDDDLVAIDGLGHDTSLETLEPDVMMELLGRSNIEIDKISCDSSPTDGGPNTVTSVVKVAMVSMKLQNWNIEPRAQWLPFATDIGYSSESRGSSPLAVPGSLPIPTILRDTGGCDTSRVADHSDSAPSTPQDLPDSALRGLGRAAGDIILALYKIRNSPSTVWPSLSRFAQVDRNRVLSAVAITCCVASLLGWVFSFTWDVIFKLFFTLLLASFPLSVWFESEYESRYEYRYRRQLDDLYERVEALQHHIASQSLQLNPTAPAVITDLRYGLPITARAIPADLEQSSTEGIVQPVIPEGNYDGRSEESIFDLGDTEHRAKRRGPSAESLMESIVRPAIPQGNNDDKSEESIIDLGDTEHRAERRSPSAESLVPTAQHSPPSPRPLDTSRPRRFSAVWAGDHPRLRG